MGAVFIFDDSKSCINHAQKRIAEFEREWYAFSNANPYAKVVDTEADGLTKVHKVILTKPMPMTLTHICVEIITHLRSSLDFLGFRCAQAVGGRIKDTKFPFGEVCHTKNFAECSCRDIPKNIFDIMVSFEPYKGGGSHLSAFNQMRNAKLHKLLMIWQHFFGHLTGQILSLFHNRQVINNH